MPQLRKKRGRAILAIIPRLRRRILRIGIYGRGLSFPPFFDGMLGNGGNNRNNRRIDVTNTINININIINHPKSTYCPRQNEYPSAIITTATTTMATSLATTTPSSETHSNPSPKTDSDLPDPSWPSPTTKYPTPDVALAAKIPSRPSRRPCPRIRRVMPLPFPRPPSTSKGVWLRLARRPVLRRLRRRRCCSRGGVLRVPS
mmetsp:Transcript_19166/g.40217  ORF Transcript_19166/g.40217 Transcript_19166/m.40217 type:complete len:202 (-) Transcript_19166:113-718(-)